MDAVGVFLHPAGVSWLLAFVLAGCGPDYPACEPVAVVEDRWSKETDALVDSGACDGFESLFECPAYRELDVSQRVRQSQADARCSK